MVPQTQPRKRRNSQKVNLLISLSFHAAIVLALAYLAAREGLLGRQLKRIAVELVKEKPPESPKEPEKPRSEPPKAEPARPDPPRAATPQNREPPRQATPPPAFSIAAAPPSAPPPAADVPSFAFEGGRAVESASDPVQHYRSFVEYALRSNWERPDDIDDKRFVVEVELSVDRSGRVSNPDWKRTSGNPRWDASVRTALAATPSISRPPPANFPPRVLVRFDVQEVTDAFAP